MTVRETEENIEQIFPELSNLIDIINKESTDSVKFPVSAVYRDKQNKTIWCRPLIEFHEKFKLVQ